MKHFLAIIGGGPAGYTAAEIASRAGKDVILFEQTALGGTCLNVGCIPTKTLLYSAKQYYNAKNATKYGVSTDNVTFDYTKIAQRKTKVVRNLSPQRPDQPGDHRVDGKLPRTSSPLRS